jgi:NOL1/NOP2/fmu family ribosome biogenesis protein
VNAEQRAGKNGKNESMSKLAKMSKPSKSSKSSSSATPSGAASSGVSLLACLEKFWVEHFQIALDGPLELRGEYVYKVPVELPDLSGIKVVKPGWFLGSVHHGRFEPSQALAMGLQPGECLRTVKLAGASTDALRYLKGETLHLADSALVRANDSVAAKGYTLVTLDGYPVGWAKWQDGMLKNEYPAGWRWT